MMGNSLSLAYLASLAMASAMSPAIARAPAPPAPTVPPAKVLRQRGRPDPLPKPPKTLRKGRR
jgi:hypothetical protein